jgi:transcriptional regulator with XRE-family HTH domain
MPASHYEVPRPVAALIGQRIEELLNERGISLYRLEQATGISQGTSSRWIGGAGSPSLGTLLFLVDFFDLCSIEEILGGYLGTHRCRAAVDGPAAHRDQRRAGTKP